MQITINTAAQLRQFSTLLATKGLVEVTQNGLVLATVGVSKEEAIRLASDYPFRSEVIPGLERSERGTENNPGAKIAETRETVIVTLEVENL